jgi:hypothetical protein
MHDEKEKKYLLAQLNKALKLNGVALPLQQLAYGALRERDSAPQVSSGGSE